MDREKIKPPFKAGKDLREGEKAEEVGDNELMDLPTAGSKPFESDTERIRNRIMGRPYGGA